MRRTAPLLLALFLGPQSACGSSEGAPPSSATTTPPAAALSGGGGAAPVDEARAPFLWEVRSGERFSKLFGTMNVGVTLERALPEAQRERLLAAETVVVEADPASLGPNAAVQAMMLPAEQRLSAMVSSEVWERLATELGGEVPAAALDRLRPWAVNVVFVQHWVRGHLSSAPSEGMDLAIIAGARSRQQPLVFLEEAQWQLDLIGDIPDAYFLESLAEMVGEDGEAERQIAGLVESYTRGDLPAIEAIVFDPEDMARTPEYYDLFLYRRNAAWMATLEPLLRVRGGAFVAVGLAHMLGPRGLVASLRDEGFTVSRL